MPDPEILTTYAGYFIGFTILLVIGVMVVAQVMPQATNSTSGPFSGTLTTISTQVNQGFNLLSIGVVIFGAILVLKALDIF